MAAKKLYRIKKEFILEVKDITPHFCELAFQQGYTFIKKEGTEQVYLLNSTKTLKTLSIDLVEVQIIF